tara:strand:+ start:396 stop:1154 length:759 start_codon:yes stop_codon:yes gene_type:complete
MGSIVGSILGSNKAASSADRAADMQRQTGREAAEAARFKPYTVTSGFGTGKFDGQTASYELSPFLAQYRDQLYGLNQEAMAGINMDTTANAQAYYDQQQGLMAGGREAEDIALRQQQLQSGRIGLGVSGVSQGAGAGTGYINPQQYQMSLARGRQDQELAAMADDRGRQQLDADILRAQGLFQSGAGVEALGQSAMTLGADLGKAQAVAGENMAEALLSGGMAGAQSNLAAGMNKANKYKSLGDSFSSIFGF